MKQMTIFDQLSMQHIGADFNPTNILPYRMLRRGKIARYKSIRSKGLRLIQFSPTTNKDETIFRLYWNTPFGSQHSKWHLINIDLGKDFNFATIPEMEYQELLKLSVKKSWSVTGLYKD